MDASLKADFKDLCNLVRSCQPELHHYGLVKVKAVQVKDHGKAVTSNHLEYAKLVGKWGLAPTNEDDLVVIRLTFRTPKNFVGKRIVSLKYKSLSEDVPVYRVPNAYNIDLMFSVKDRKQIVMNKMVYGLGIKRELLAYYASMIEYDSITANMGSSFDGSYFLTSLTQVCQRVQEDFSKGINYYKYLENRTCKKVYYKLAYIPVLTSKGEQVEVARIVAIYPDKPRYHDLVQGLPSYSNLDNEGNVSRDNILIDLVNKGKLDYISLASHEGYFDDYFNLNDQEYVYLKPIDKASKAE